MDALLAWSRWRFVRVARQKAPTTIWFLADRTGCLKGGVANVVVPTTEYVRFATGVGFRPDVCEAADPE